MERRVRGCRHRLMGGGPFHWGVARGCEPMGGRGRKELRAYVGLLSLISISPRPCYHGNIARLNSDASRTIIAVHEWPIMSACGDPYPETHTHTHTHNSGMQGIVG